MANDKSLNGKRVAIIATDGFEQAELLEPRKALQEAGATAEVVSPKAGKIKGWNHIDWGQEVQVDKTIDSVHASDYDALLLPGGVMNPDKLRRNPKVLQFVKEIFDAGKPIAAICHGPWTLIDAGVVKGRKMTSYESIQTDLKNAGAIWSDEPVVTDRGLITSRKPDDIPQFNKKMLEEFREGIHNRQSQAAHTQTP
jgi:protease I